MTRLYDYGKMYEQKVSNILDVGTTFQQFITLVTPNLEPGKYLIAISWEANYNGQKSQPMITQMTGTFSGTEWYDSIGDKDDGVRTRYYAFPKDWGGGAITLGIQGKKDPSFSKDLDINYIDVMVSRVG